MLEIIARVLKVVATELIANAFQTRYRRGILVLVRVTPHVDILPGSQRTGQRDPQWRILVRTIVHKKAMLGANLCITDQLPRSVSRVDFEYKAETPAGMWIIDFGMKTNSEWIQLGIYVHS